MNTKRIEKPNYTQFPNAVIDEMMREMSESELRVVIAICRKTFGWQKTRDRISMSQIEELSGLSHQAVFNGIHQALERGIIQRYPVGKQSFVYEVAIFEDEETSQRSLLAPVNVVDGFEQKPVNVVDIQKKGTKEKKERTDSKNESDNVGRTKPFEIAQALANVGGMEFNANKGRLLREAKLLLSSKPEPTSTLIMEKFGVGGWYYSESSDWRAKKKELPKPHIVRELWGVWCKNDTSPRVTSRGRNLAE